MAAKILRINEEFFNCSICLDLLKDPVTIPCGHIYCMSCVNTHWNGEGGKQSYSCPQCRQNFTQRPVPVKSTTLALLMEVLKKSGPPAAPASHCSAAQGEVSCDLCSTSKVKAVKSCLQCLVSYCEEHLQPHYDVAALKKHKLVEPTGNLQDNRCPRHDEVMKMFCRTDQQCICYLCSVDEHKDHDIVTAAAERTEQDEMLRTVKAKLLDSIKYKEGHVDGLQKAMKNIISSANEAVDSSNQGPKQLISLIEKRMRDVKKQNKSKKEAEMQRGKELQDKLQQLTSLTEKRMSEVQKQIRSQQEAEMKRGKELLDRVKQEITELKRQHNEVESILCTEDPIQFLHKLKSLHKDKTSDSLYKVNCTLPAQVL